MKSRKEQIYGYLIEKTEKYKEEDIVYFTTQEVSEALSMHRSNVSAFLNEYVKENRLEKVNSRPVKFYLADQYEIKNDTDTFSEIIGADGSLKNMIQLAKAALLYPNGMLPTLIIGDNGVGKSIFAEKMYIYAKEMSILTEDAKYIKIDCAQYTEGDNLHLELFEEDNGIVERLKKGRQSFLFIDNIDQLLPKSRNSLIKSMEEGLMVICAARKSTSTQLGSTFSVQINLPSLSERPLEERFQLLKSFFSLEAAKMNKKIKVNAELLRSLLLYNTEGNIKQFRNDIKLGCANAYLRTYSQVTDELYIYMNDFPAYIRKGFLHYKKNKKIIEKLIPSDYSYTFTAANLRKIKNENNHSNESIYDIISKKSIDLKNRGLAEDEVNTIISADLDQDFRKLKKTNVKTSISKKSITKLVDSRIVELVEDFLREASKVLDRVFSKETFYGLCLHISATLEYSEKSLPVVDEKIENLQRDYKKEYTLTNTLIEKIEKEFCIHLPKAEFVFLSMFILQENLKKDDSSQPVILVATHGDAIATSVVKLVQELINVDNIYAYDLALDTNMEKAYEELKQIVLGINQGAGILFLYDMGSLRSMIDNISLETKVKVKSIEIPLTLIALEASRKATNTMSLDSLHAGISEAYQQNIYSLRNNYVVQEQTKIIITLCMSGEGTAIQIKNYLYENLIFEDIEIIPLGISDKNILLETINRLQEKHQIIALIGTYDPEIYNLPFIPISQIFETPVDKLNLLLSYKGINNVTHVNYKMIYKYLSEQLPKFDIITLKETLPRAIRQVKTKINKLTLDQELGLFLHVATNIYRIQYDEPLVINIHRNKIINANKKAYHELTTIFKEIEDEFAIEFTEDDYANMIGIIKEL